MRLRRRGNGKRQWITWRGGGRRGGGGGGGRGRGASRVAVRERQEGEADGRLPRLCVLHAESGLERRVGAVLLQAEVGILAHVVVHVGRPQFERVLPVCVERNPWEIGLTRKTSATYLLPSPLPICRQAAALCKSVCSSRSDRA